MKELIDKPKLIFALNPLIAYECMPISKLSDIEFEKKIDVFVNSIYLYSQDKYCYIMHF